MTRINARQLAQAQRFAREGAEEMCTHEELEQMRATDDGMPEPAEPHSGYKRVQVQSPLEVKRSQVKEGSKVRHTRTGEEGSYYRVGAETGLDLITWSIAGMEACLPHEWEPAT